MVKIEAGSAPWRVYIPKAVGTEKNEDVMAKRTLRPLRAHQFSSVMKNLVVAGVIACGAVLWGVAIYHVAIRTL